ncbi:hypothetical protein LS48_08980 [Aequorivita aquimaris]|uniref:Uncharacterized protein n=1 Tax=Aequorivita aquimaris TaxID=1548749 RepID=A0A137RGS0_9FLAO|nr:hypothetical protein [Aequorivita aquimaris]KXN98688.1 hypothetical protein LS48_08980 [Aequorivita aquimaris]
MKQSTPPHRRIVFLLFFMITCAATAQTFMDNVRAEIQTKIQHLNQNDVPTRILYDRTLPHSNLLGYGTPSGFAPLVPSVPNSSAGHYFLAMEDLYRIGFQAVALWSSII